MRLIVLFLSACVLAACVTAGPGALTSEGIVDAFSDEELIHGFMWTVFGSEVLRRDRRDRDTVNRVKKFDAPVRVHAINRASIDRSASVAEFVGVLDTTVEGLRIAMVPRTEEANVVVFLVDRADYRRTIRQTLPDDIDTGFLEGNACSAVTGGRRSTGLERAFVYVVANEGRRNFRHCLVEEVSQSLGPVNDDSRLPHSIFNDDSEIAGFGVFDWFILNMLYDRRVRNGMTAAEVRRVLPAAIRDARARLPGVLRKRGLLGAQAGG